MPASCVMGFSEDIPTMTFAEGIAFIDRTRRQLDRIDVAFPGMQGRHIAPEAEASIRTKLDELEVEITRSLETI